MHGTAAPERATVSLVPPTGDELRRALAPYAHPAGGWLCPCCGHLLRVLERASSLLKSDVLRTALREIAANAREALETITVDAPQPRRLPPHRVERSTSPFPYVTPDEHWEMREAITRVLSAWYSTACVGGNSDAEAARITIEELTPYRIESAGNADAEVPDA